MGTTQTELIPKYTSGPKATLCTYADRTHFAYQSCSDLSFISFYTLNGRFKTVERLIFTTFCFILRNKHINQKLADDFATCGPC